VLCLNIPTRLPGPAEIFSIVTAAVTANAARVTHADVAQQIRVSLDLVFQGQGRRIDQEFDVGTPNAKRDVVSPPGKFSGHLWVSWLNCSLRLATLDDGHLVVTLPQTHYSDSKGLRNGQIRMRLKGRTALRIE